MKKWNLIQNQPLLCQIFKEPPIISDKKGKLWQRTCFSRAKRHGFMLVYMCTCQPFRFFAKNNLRIQKGRVGFFLYVQLTFLSYFFIVPCKQQRNQVRIYNKSFLDFISNILADKGEINILNKPGLINEV